MNDIDNNNYGITRSSIFSNPENISLRPNYYLMSLDTIVAELTLVNGKLIASSFINVNRLPVRVKDFRTLERWFESRRIPSSRKHLDDLLRVSKLGLEEIIQKSLGLSLSDSFWLCPINEDLKWADVNFFINDFSDDVGEFLMAGGELSSLSTPSNVTDGVMAKKWIIKNNIRYLVKQSTGSARQHLNEVLAYKIAQVLGLDAARYFKFGDDSCLCPCFVKPGQNLVTALDWLSRYTDLNPSGINNKDYFVPLCKVFGEQWITGMLVLDFITMNDDRHLKNFCLIQDAETGEIIKPAPIFDNGNSLFHVIDFGKEHPFVNLKEHSRPFISPHYHQISMVNIAPFHAKLDALKKKIPDMVAEVYDGSGLRLELVDGMGLLLQQRIRYLIN